MYAYTVLDDILGLTIDSVDASEWEIIFRTKEGRSFRMYHEQDCCEGVWVEDVAGDWSDLVGAPLVRAEERTEFDPDAYESGMWTFYEFATIKGSVTVRWYGSSDRYSVSVDLVEFKS